MGRILIGLFNLAAYCSLGDNTFDSWPLTCREATFSWRIFFSSTKLSENVVVLSRVYFERDLDMNWVVERFHICKRT